ncbi:hypothetical protein [Halorubrum sp. DTA46]|uniref:hypothetical protein n=1 Tax=Halorubrum sp. DTA46 TaxID=3402162 RepID=UPI003AABB937
MTEKSQTGNRVPKNLNVRQETADKLEEMAVERHGSRYKQGQVVDDLVANESSDDLISMVSDLHTAILSSDDESGDTHTTKPELTADNPAEELERLAKEQGYLVQSEHDLSVLAGARGIDKTAIYIACLRGQNAKRVTKKEVRDMIMRDVGVSYNSANQHAQQVILQLSAAPLADLWAEIDTIIDDTIEMGHNKRGHGLISKEELFENIDDIEDCLGVDNDLMTTDDVYYLDDAELERNLIRDLTVSRSGDARTMTSTQIAMIDALEGTEYAEIEMVSKLMSDIQSDIDDAEGEL